MMTRTTWLGLLVGALFMLPAAARGQDMNVGAPSWEFPIPTMWDQRDEGLYFAAEALFFRINNPVRSQVLAVRGFWDTAGTINGQGALIDALDNATPPNVIARLFAERGVPGAFIGSKEPALTSGMVGQDKWEPGFRLALGYRLRNGMAIEFSVWHLAEFTHSAGAGIIPQGATGFPGAGVGSDLASSFLSAPFFNFTPDFAGPSRDVVSNIYPNAVVGGVGAPLSPQQIADILQYGGIPVAAYGIWNGAEDMRIEFLQRAWNAELNVRLPVNQTECERTYVITGARVMNIWERFSFRTVDLDIDSIPSPLNTATYYNEWENQLYGGQVGGGYEYYLGQGFAWSVEGRVGLFLDYRKTKVSVERGDVDPRTTREDVSLSPFFQGGLYLWWYPLEGVQCRAGYEFLGIFNVRRSEQPVSFDLGKLDATYEDMFLRFDGFSAGIAFIF